MFDAYRIWLKVKSPVQLSLQNKKMRESEQFKQVFICPDRTAKQRELHRELVKQLKSKISEEPNKRFFTKGEKIICSSD